MQPNKSKPQGIIIITKLLAYFEILNKINQNIILNNLLFKNFEQSETQIGRINIKRSVRSQASYFVSSAVFLTLLNRKMNFIKLISNFFFRKMITYL